MAYPHYVTDGSKLHDVHMLKMAATEKAQFDFDDATARRKS